MFLNVFPQKATTMVKPTQCPKGGNETDGLEEWFPCEHATLSDVHEHERSALNKLAP